MTSPYVLVSWPDINEYAPAIGVVVVTDQSLCAVVVGMHAASTLSSSAPSEAPCSGDVRGYSTCLEVEGLTRRD